MSEVKLKLCQHCKTELPIYLFRRNKGTKDGMYCYCRLCDKVVNKRYKLNPILRKLNKQRYRFKHRESINKKQNWIRKNRKFKSMANTANRLSRIKSTGETITKNDLWRIAKKQKLKCAISGIKLNNDNISLDHITPFCRGGKNVCTNIQLVHNTINLMKGSFYMRDFLETIKIISDYQRSLILHESTN